MLASFAIDPLADLLDGPRARGAFLLRSVLEPPWSLRIRDEAPLTLVTAVRGEAVLVPDAGDALSLGAGDVAVVRGPDHYTVADAPGTAPQIVIHPGQVCETLAGEPLDEALDLGVRTWGTGGAGAAVLLTGTYELAGEISRRLLDALPQMLVVPAAEADGALTALLGTEIGKDEPGQSAVLDRLLDLLLISTLRAWFARAGAHPPAWYATHADPAVGRALRMMEHHPSHPWTVASLARATNLSRAAFARRFTALVGQPPLAFLTAWRLDLAADLLVETDGSIAAIADQVGYGSPFALSTAFKRARGVSPRAYRAREQVA